MQIHVPCSTGHVISFDGQGQLYPLTCAGGRDLQNHVRMSTMPARKPEKRAKNIKLKREFRWKSFSTTRLHFHLTLRSWHLFRRLFSPKWSRVSKCPANEKKVGEKSQRKKEGRKAKSKNQHQLFHFKTHARTSEADSILPLEGKAAKRTTCKRLFGKFYLLIVRQWPENDSTSFKTRFSAKFPGGE